MRTTALLFLALGIVRGAGRAGAAEPSEEFAELRAFLEREMARLEIPCLSIALVDGGKVLWQAGLGFQDAPRGIRATEDTVYRVGSISKLFTAMAVMQLSERGLLDIDAPVTRSLPELVFKDPFNSGTPIALRHLLSHRSGILRESPAGNYFDDTEPGIEKTVRSIIGSELIYPVGEKTKYSNLGPTIAGLIVEKLSRTPFPEYMEKHLLQPMGMASSSFLPDKEVVRKGLAKAFMVDFDGKSFPAPTFSLGTIPAGNLYSTAADMARFLITLFAGGEAGGGRVLAKETLERMFTVQFPAKDQPSGFGIGFFVNRLGEWKTVSHNGAVYGFASAVAAIPEEKVGVVVLNDVDCANGFNEKVVRKALGLLLARKGKGGIPPLPVPIPLAPEKLEEFAGKFRSGEREARVSVKDGRLRVQALGVPHDAVSIAADRFIADGRLGYGLAFDFGRGADGKVASLTAGGLEYRKVPEEEPPAAVPEDLLRFAGRYGWPHNVLLVYVKDGRLTCRVEWFYEYPLKRRGGSTFAFPDYGLYENERLEFVEDGARRIVEVRMGSVPFKRLPGEGPP